VNFVPNFKNWACKQTTLSLLLKKYFSLEKQRKKLQQKKTNKEVIRRPKQPQASANGISSNGNGGLPRSVDDGGLLSCGGVRSAS